ncbi:MAG: carboxypeptidase-like regulatory domain-containing protein [Bacteroidales bacterium]|nr:carboxypeptidase-like regulatory domain-containing protein [Bacteroidales bacterium]
MRKFLFSILLILFIKQAYTQVITGCVLDEKDKTAICCATAYFNGTYVGAIANEQGNFELDCSKNKLMPITISAIGYFSVTLYDYQFDEPLIIYLKPKIYQLSETTIQAKSLKRKRKRYLKLFKEEFLGTTENALLCTLLNEEDITFNYETDKDTIKVFALNPIQVENKALAYQVTYYLDKFEYYKQTQSTYFEGNIQFKERNIAAQDQHKIKEKRELCYLGSRMHFIRALWLNRLQSNGFTVTTLNYQKLNEEDLVSQKGGRKFFNYKQDIYIYFDRKISRIRFLFDRVYFDESGFFIAAGIHWKGAMGEQRIADWLPYEYQY